MKAETLAVLLAGAASMIPVTAQAQSADSTPAAATEQAATPPADETGDIVVTAQRREQSVLSVPIAISAVSGNTLASKGITNSADLASAVPNLQVSSPYGSTQPNFSDRKSVV